MLLRAMPPLAPVIEAATDEQQSTWHQICGAGAVGLGCALSAARLARSQLGRAGPHS
jgi:hypothetical protein